MFLHLSIARLYADFDLPVVADVDCGQMCAPNNPHGKPFCCDICHAVPVAYPEEWDYLHPRTDLWHVWRGDECDSTTPQEIADLRAQLPDDSLYLACLGPARCVRPYRALSCREFPFFPYVTADYRFVGLSIEWEFEQVCWVLQNLGQVSAAYRQAFVATFDAIFAARDDIFESYAAISEQMRAEFARRRRRIPILHRNGKNYLLSPGSERMRATVGIFAYAKK